MNISIKRKHHIIIALVVFGLAITSLLDVIVSTKMSRYADGIHMTKSLESAMLTLRRNEKDFLARKQEKYLDKFASNHEKTLSDANKLETLLGTLGLTDEQKSVQALKAHLNTYKEQFTLLVASQRKIGFDHKSGLHGSLRKAVHAAETELSDYPLLRADMLMLRRNEKDFMARLDLKYLGKLQANVLVLKQNINNSDLSDAVKGNLKQYINKYENEFIQLVEAEKEKGLDHKSGIHGQLRNAIHQTETLFDTLHNNLDEQLDERASAASAFKLLTLIIAGSSVALFVFLVSRSIYRPLSIFETEIKRISDKHDLTSTLPVNGDDEIASLAKSFNQMISELRTTMLKVTGSTSQLDNATDDMNKVAQQVDTFCQKQSKEVEMASVALEEMTSTISHIAESATSAAAEVQSSHGDLLESTQKADEAKGEIHQLTGDIENAVQAITSLEENSHRIAGLLDEIQGIAEQTNLLALNAAIEAARAGEQGRGFAVVADEVRTLASRTHGSTESIRENIEAFKQSTAEMVTTVGNSRVRADSSIALVSESAERLNAVSQRISKVSEMNSQVATAAEQQSYAAQEVARNVANVNELATEIRDESERTVKLSGSLNESSSDLNELVANFKIQ